MHIQIMPIICYYATLEFRVSVILIRLGYILANVSMAASRSMVISRCMWRSVSPVSLVLVIVDLKAVLLLLRLLKDLGSACGDLKCAEDPCKMLGYIELT